MEARARRLSREVKAFQTHRNSAHAFKPSAKDGPRTRLLRDRSSSNRAAPRHYVRFSISDAVKSILRPPQPGRRHHFHGFSDLLGIAHRANASANV